MFEVTVEHTFAAGHALRGYHGKCENTHGHNYRVRLTLRGRDLDLTIHESAGRPMPSVRYSRDKPT